MATDAQIKANRENAKKSTGPRTPEGKLRVARNAIKDGLWASEEFYANFREEAYIEFCAQLRIQLAPATPLEEVAADQIIHASWRMQRCGMLERHEEDDDEDPILTDRQDSIDLARARANRIFHKQLAELRRLQAERFAQAQIEPEALPEDLGVAETAEIAKRIAKSRKQSQSGSKPISRNADCPCGSGLKFKRCCGKDAPPVLNNTHPFLPEAA